MSSVNKTLETNAPTRGLVNYQIIEFFMTFNLVVCAELIGFCGIVGNVVNIFNFARQGLQDSVNITLTALAVSDLGALVTQSLVNVMVNPFWDRVPLPFSSLSMFSTQFFYPHGYFIRVSGFITAFASFERCLCVVLPLSVKRVVTRNVTLVVTLVIYVVLLVYLIPLYVTYLDLRYYPRMNRTVVDLFYRSNVEGVLRISYLLTDLLVPYLTFFILIVCTTVIIFKLKSKARWRRAVTRGVSEEPKKHKLSGKEERVVVMLTTVSVIFVACLTPNAALLTALGIVRDLKLDGMYFDVGQLCYSFSSLLETINCSVNIVVYYNMSTKYREGIHLWFPGLKKSK